MKDPKIQTDYRLAQNNIFQLRQDIHDEENHLDALWQDVKAGFTYQHALDTRKKQQEEWLSAVTTQKIETRQKTKEALKLTAMQEW